MQEENELLQEELSRLENLLTQAGSEQDELAGRYHALSERVSVYLGYVGTSRRRQAAWPAAGRSPPETGGQRAGTIVESWDTVTGDLSHSTSKPNPKPQTGKQAGEGRVRIGRCPGPSSS